MAKYDPVSNQCKVTYSAGTVTESPYGIADKLQIYFTLPGEDDWAPYYVDWKYHCPGGQEAVSNSDGYLPGDIVLVECDENGYPMKVVGHADGAEPCNIVYAVAWFNNSDTILLKYNEKQRWFDIYQYVYNKYKEYGQESHFSGFSQCISVQFADDYPYRIIAIMQLVPSSVGQLAGYYVQGKYCVVDIHINLDAPFWEDEWEGTEVHFVGLGKIYDDYPYWEDYLEMDCSGNSKPSEEVDESVYSCGFSFDNPCTGSSQHACQCGTKVGGCYSYGEWTTCSQSCSCCQGEPDTCTDDCCCDLSICASTNYSWSCYNNGSLECTYCSCSPIPIGTYADGKTGQAEIWMAGRRIFEKVTYDQTRTSGTECSVPTDCCERPCGNPTPVISIVGRYIVPKCAFTATKDVAIWRKNIDAVAADPSWNGRFDYGNPYDTIALAAPDGWTQHDCGFLSCGPDGCVRGTSWVYSFIVNRLIGENKWQYGWSKYSLVDTYDPTPPGGCDCDQQDIENTQNETENFSYSFPGTPEGETDGGWEILGNMLKGSLQSYIIGWVYGNSYDHLVSTSSLGSNLQFQDGLPIPLDNPGKVGVLISDINTAGFAIGGGKIQAFAGFEINAESGKVQPIGQYIYQWTVGFNATTLKRNVALMVWQEPVS